MLEEAYGVSLTAGRITYAEIFSCKYNLTFPHSLNLMGGVGGGLVLVVFWSFFFSKSKLQWCTGFNKRQGKARLKHISKPLAEMNIWAIYTSL